MTKAELDKAFKAIEDEPKNSELVGVLSTTNYNDKDKVIVRSFPIYELLQIRIEGHRYPRRRICQQRLGFFDTKEHAEEAMLSTVEFQKRVCQERGQNYYDDCFGFFLLEQFVHNRECSFYRNERPQKCFSFNADGELNDFVALDEMGLY